MRVRFLGTGGATRTPRPGCRCRACRIAGALSTQRRGGPSLWIPDAGLLVDTPEDTYHYLLKYQITSVKYLTYTHFHRDHTMGVGALEELLVDHLKRNHRKVALLVPRDLLDSLLENIKVFEFYFELGILDFRPLEPLRPLSLGRVSLTPIPLREAGFYGYMIGDLLYIPDHLAGLEPERVPKRPRVCAFETPRFLPMRGGYEPPDSHRVFWRNLSPGETVALARELGAELLVITHIEEIFGREHGELVAWAREQVPRTLVARDGMLLVI